AAGAGDDGGDVDDLRDERADGAAVEIEAGQAAIEIHRAAAEDERAGGIEVDAAGDVEHAAVQLEPARAASARADLDLVGDLQPRHAATVGLDGDRPVGAGVDADAQAAGVLTGGVDGRLAGIDVNHVEARWLPGVPVAVEGISAVAAAPPD